MNSRRDFLKRVGIGAAAIGAGVLARKPLPSEANYVSTSTVGRPVEGKAAVYDRVSHMSWSESTFIKKLGEFKNGDILLHIDKRLIEVNVPCSLNALYCYTYECFDDFLMMGHPSTMLCPTREWGILHNGWRFKDELSIKNIRNGGFEHIGLGIEQGHHDYTTAYSKDEFVYMGVHTMGAVGFDKQLYYRSDHSSRGSAMEPFYFKGAVNEVIKVRRDMKWLEIECDGKGYHHVFDEPVEPMCYRFPFQTEGY